MKNKVLICSKHDEILELCESILQINFDKPFEVKLRKLVRKIMDTTAAARVNGQSMEDRLYEYHNAITDIGFKREKRKRK